MLGLVLAVGVTATMPVTYQAEASAFVGVTASDGRTTGNNSLYQGSQFALQRVKSYPQLVMSPDVLQPVINNLQLPMTLKQLRKMLTVVNPTDTVFLNLTVTSSDAAQAGQIADAALSQLGTVIRRLETPKAGGTAPITVTTVMPAVVGSGPISPRRSLNYALGLLLGLAAGAIAAVVREQRDTTVRTEDLQRISGRPLVGVIAENRDAKRNPLVVLGHNRPAVEGYRRMRTNVQFLNVQEPLRQIVVTSSSPHEGKTTTACNLAIALAQSSLRVCLVEADLREPTMASYLQIPAAQGLSDVLTSSVELDDVLVPWRDGLLTVLTAGTLPSDPALILSRPPLVSLLEELGRRFDYVVIDSPPLRLASDAALIARFTDGVLVVVRYAKTRREHLSQALSVLGAVGVRLTGTVLTFAPNPEKDMSYGNGYGYGDASMTDFVPDTT